MTKGGKMATPPVELVVPAEGLLPAYVSALRRGWSADNIRGAVAAMEELARIESDPVGFIQTKADDREAKGGPVRLPDGSEVQRLPGFFRWIWDGEFCGSISLRWQPGTAALPPHVLGHIGYAVVPWKRNRGYATQALALMLDEARAVGLPYVELTADPDNPVSQKVILANGGVFIETFELPAQYGVGLQSFRYRVTLRS
jgi:predicted acetyltransferase